MFVVLGSLFWGRCSGVVVHGIEMVPSGVCDIPKTADSNI